MTHVVHSNYARVLQFGVVGYHLYLLYYPSNSNHASEYRDLVNDHVTERIGRLAVEGCNVTFSAKNVRNIAKTTHDAYDVNLAMMDAYLDDEVDFFLLLFSHVRSSPGDDLQRLPSRSRSWSYYYYLQCRRKVMSCGTVSVDAVHTKFSCFSNYH